MLRNKDFLIAIKYVCIIFLLLCFFLIPLSYSQYMATQNNKAKPDPNYKIKPGDIINIVVGGYDYYSKNVIVDQKGIVKYSTFEDIKASNLTLSQFQKELEYRLHPYISFPQIKLEIKEEEPLIKPGDTLNIIVKDNEEYNQSLVVNKNGKINYQNFSDIQVAGLTPSQIKTSIQQILDDKIFNPDVTVSTLLEDYVIKPGDLIKIKVKDHENFNYESKIQNDGLISHPTLGNIKVANKTKGMIRDEIKTLLTPYITEPEVDIFTEAGQLEIEEIKTEKAKIDEKKEEKEYLIVPGDIADIIVKDHGNYNLMVIVQPDGKIQYPRLGEIHVAGFTEKQAGQIIGSRLGIYIDNPNVTIKVKGRSVFSEIKKEELAYYTIKPGDTISIKIDGRSNYDYVMIVQSNGMIIYPPIGNIQIAGKTAKILTETIVAKLPIRIAQNQIQIVIKEFKRIPDEIERIESLQPETSIKRFGMDIFISAKNALQIEKTQSNDSKEYQKDAISGFVSPTDMIDKNINITVPERYILGSGDIITITYWSESDVLDRKAETVVVDNEGSIVMDKIGKMVIRGMTLAQFQESIKAELSRVAFKDLQLTVTLDKLKSIQIFITGETFSPGSYAVSSATTLFNTLYLCGGPNNNGTLRDIKVIKANETKSVDFYKFLMSGDSSQDYQLSNGDTILIPQVGKLVTIGGEIKRPAIYELKEGESLKEIIQFAGGLRPTGYLQRVKIDSVDPNRKRVIFDIDLSNDISPNATILDGDVVTVFSIPSDIVNTVTVEGKVNMPGLYQLKEGMKISDLINSAQGLLGEAYMERADLLRLNSDKRTTTLIPIELSKAISGDSENNIILNQWDKLIIYSKWDIKWTADRIVNIHGAIKKPGSYERSDKMTIYDLLIKAGGVSPNAYTQYASLMRLNDRGELTRHIPISLEFSLNKDLKANLELEDGDTLLIYTYKEAKWEAKRVVVANGAVQRNGTFTRTDDMKISDLIKMAGGLLPDAYLNRALLLRYDERRNATQSFTISPKLAMENDPKNDLELKDGDELKIYTFKEAKWEPERKATINGAIQKPGIFQRTDNMRVSDLVNMAGGILPNAYIERADILRFDIDWETQKTIPVNIGKALSGDESANILIEDGDILQIYTINEAIYKPKETVSIYGAVQRPDTYTKTVNMKLSDLLFMAGGMLPGADTFELARIDENGKRELIKVDPIAISNGDTSKDILLLNKDILFIRREKEYLEALRIIILNGEVKYPGSYALKSKERLSELIERAGGLTDRAYPESATVSRNIEYLVLDEQRKSSRQVSELFKDITDQEYKREYAKAMMERQSKYQEANVKSGLIASSIPTGLTNLGSITGISQQMLSTTSDLGEFSQYQYTMVTPARKITNILPSGRLLIDVKKALGLKNSEDNIILEDGDIINIPAMPITIFVTGAVIQPSSHIYNKKNKVSDYISMSGGFARDADEKSVYIIKANGMVIKGNKAKLFPGDIIVVPTRVMVQKVTDRWGQVFGFMKFALGTLATAYILKIIVGNI